MTPSLTSIGREIHKRRVKLFTIEKAEQGILPYAFAYKDPERREQVKDVSRKEMDALLLERERIKNMTPKEHWYPKRKYSGRYSDAGNDVKTQVMREAFMHGFNLKSIADYFNLELSAVYKRVKVKDRIKELMSKDF